MIINGRTVVIKHDFDEMLDDIAFWYISEGFDKYAKNLVKNTYEAIVEKIAPNPEKYPEHAFKRTNKIYRRYILQKKYYIIYKISLKKLEILAIVYSRRDLNNIEID